MKAIYTLLICLLTCYAAYAQVNTPDLKTKAVKEKHSEYTLKYNVLQENPAIKHGPYTMTSQNWRCEGKYENGKRSGVWAFYGWNGMTDYKYDFTNNQELQSKSLVNELEVYENGAYVKMEVGNKPFLIGGEGRMLAFIVKNLRYPSQAFRANAQGLVVITVEINEAGELTNSEVNQSAGHGMDEEALRVVRSLPNEWIPAMIDGKPVKSKHHIPVRFSIRR